MINKNINGYELSKDYTRLKALLDKGYLVVCFVDFNFRDLEEKGYPPCRDICQGRKSKDYNTYDFGARGISYLDWSSSFSKEYEKYPTFEQMCKMGNIEFIDINK
jgi:hypothetical protein